MTDPAPGTFADPGLPLSDRVTDLLTRLTAAEKVALLHQHDGGLVASLWMRSSDESDRR